MARRVVLLLHTIAYPQTVGFGSVFGVGWVVGAAAVVRIGGCWGRTGCGGRNGSRGGGGRGMVACREERPVSRWRWTLKDAAGSHQGGQGWRRARRYITLLQTQHHVDGLLLQLTQVGGTYVTATVTLVPCLIRAVGHLQFIMEQKGEGGILWTEREQREKIEDYVICTLKNKGSERGFSKQCHGEPFLVISFSEQFLEPLF